MQSDIRSTLSDKKIFSPTNEKKTYKFTYLDFNYWIESFLFSAIGETFCFCGQHLSRSLINAVRLLNQTYAITFFLRFSRSYLQLSKEVGLTYRVLEEYLFTSWRIKNPYSEEEISKGTKEFEKQQVHLPRILSRERQTFLLNHWLELGYLATERFHCNMSKVC